MQDEDVRHDGQDYLMKTGISERLELNSNEDFFLIFSRAHYEIKTCLCICQGQVKTVSNLI